MAFKVPAEIHELVPEELRSKYGIYWSSKGERYYVFRDVAHVYDPSKKRSSVKRVALGSINLKVVQNRHDTQVKMTF